MSNDNTKQAQTYGGYVIDKAKGAAKTGAKIGAVGGAAIALGKPIGIAGLTLAGGTAINAAGLAVQGAKVIGTNAAMIGKIATGAAAGSAVLPGMALAATAVAPVTRGMWRIGFGGLKTGLNAMKYVLGMEDTLIVDVKNIKRGVMRVAKDAVSIAATPVILGGIAAGVGIHKAKTNIMAEHGKYLKEKSEREKSMKEKIRESIDESSIHSEDIPDNVQFASDVRGLEVNYPALEG